MTRRHALLIGGGAAAAAMLRPAMAAEAGPSVHGISVFGDLKYPADFHHFDYVNPEAPKGGVFSFIQTVRAYNQSFLTFNTFNAYIFKGDGAQGMDLTFATLMARALDEPDAMYGLAASSVAISSDKLTYRYVMRPEARFHDGSQLTAQDAAFSLTILKEKGHPLIQQQMRDMITAEAIDDTTLVVTFAEKRARDVPLLYREPADLFKGLLRNARLRRIDAGYSAGLRALSVLADTRSIASSSMSGSRTGGAPICRCRAAATTSTPSAMNFIAIAMWRSRGSQGATICFAKNTLRGCGRPVMIFRRSGMVASSLSSFPRRSHPRRGGTSTRAVISSKMRGCVRR